MNAKVEFAFLCACLIVPLTGCNRRISAPIADVTRNQVVTLKSSGSEPSGVSLHIRGHLDGAAVIWAEGWEKQTIGQAVDFKLYKDWFEPTCDLHYDPTGVTKGDITIEYQFH